MKIIKILCLVLLLASCSQSIKKVKNTQFKQSDLQLYPTEYDQIPSWNYNDFSRSLIAFQKSCNQLAKPKRKPLLTKHSLFGDSTDWKNLCSVARKTSISDAKDFFEDSFQPVRVAAQDHSLFTGYYIPELRGSLTKNSKYRFPLYPRPNRKKLPSRAAIVNGALNKIARPILWVDSEIDSFFLHIQGSGNVRLPDNKIVHVAYAGQNGHKYYAIGHHLIKKNYVPKNKMSAQAIKNWLSNNPSKAQAVMNLNPSYIFFKLKNGDTKKLTKGAAGVSLTPEYSLAVDDEYYPYGLPMWVETDVKVPINGKLQKMAFERLMIAQDTGGAITGAIRGDIFFGSGKTAEIMAGKQKSDGQKYVLLPRNTVSKFY